jgi:hypothetical protein
MDCNFDAGRHVTRPGRRVAWVVAALGVVLCGRAEAAVKLAPADTVAGYVARLLINETPFPGEHAWVSEENTKAGMLAILCVLDSRISHIPAGYRQQEIAAEVCTDVVAVITAGGEKGQCDGFYRDSAGNFVAVARVHERIDYLVQCANKGAPGRFARLLEYAQGLADAYVREGMTGVDRFAGIARVEGVEVTGRAYSWMTDTGGYNPGGNFVRIPDEEEGSLGGNRFFTLRKLK